MENFVNIIGPTIAIVVAIYVIYLLHRSYVDYLLTSKYGWSKQNIVFIAKIDSNFAKINHNIIKRLHGVAFYERLIDNE